MNPDAFMPLYGNDLLGAVAGLENDILGAYIRLLWHYWSVNHCEGLADDHERWRKVAGVSLERWSEIDEVLFGEFFKLSGGLWHQKRAREEHAKVKAKYDRAVANGQRNILKRFPPARRKG